MFRVSLALACGLLCCTPWLNLALWPLEWIGLIPLVWLAVDSDSPAEAAKISFLAAFAGIAIAFYWLVETIHIFGDFSFAVSFLLFVGLAAYMAAQWALFGFVLRWVGLKWCGLSAAIIFVSVEFLYPNLFPYQLGAINVQAPILIQVGDLTGVYGLTFLMVWVAGAAVICIHSGRDRWRAPIAAACGVAAVLAYGAYRLYSIPLAIAQAPLVRVAMIQGNISIDRKFEPKFFADNVEHYRSASIAARADADLIVWPETVVQRGLPGSARRYDGSQNPARDIGKPVLLGAHMWDDKASGGSELYDAAILIGPDGTLWGRYNKHVLMPFGEYIPLAGWFPSLKKLDPNNTPYGPTYGPRVVAWPGHFTFAPMICYDDLFPSIARAAVAEGARLLVAIDNDAWYGDTAAITQHDTLALWRAVETRRYFVRCDNVGKTVIVDPLGREVAAARPFVDTVVTGGVHPLAIDTFYSRWGDVFAMAAIAVLAALIAGRLGLLKRR
ncbi:MAG: apolipoprotein N-acyltransferase [Candidatus Binataceae bacterium]|jgi:apolipoprotein N-acyltransferase